MISEFFMIGPIGSASSNIPNPLVTQGALEVALRSCIFQKASLLEVSQKVLFLLIADAAFANAVQKASVPRRAKEPRPEPAWIGSHGTLSLGSGEAMQLWALRRVGTTGYTLNDASPFRGRPTRSASRRCGPVEFG
jgi:hypothetical protein